MLRVIKIFLVVIFTVIFLVVLSWQQLNHFLDKPLNISSKGLEYTLPAGSSLSHLSYEFAKKGIIEYPKVLMLYARLTGVADSVKAGEYYISKGSSLRELLKNLKQGEVIQYKVTLVEGWTFKQALQQLHRQPRLTSTLNPFESKKILGQLKIKENHPEGLFYPDTYFYSAGTSDAQILERAYRRMQQVLEKLWQQRDIGLPYKSPYEALIMASIVERETGSSGERDKIAGVFVRRLQKSMRLGTDPTIIYGLGDCFDGDLRRVHLTQPGPYNTRLNRGLPPTPIALPGKSAIYASLHPDQSENLYFVAKGDGSHYFSKTLKQHNIAVRKYQIEGRVDDYRSKPQ